MHLRDGLNFTESPAERGRSSVAGGPWAAEDWQDLPLDLTTHMLAGGRKQYYLDLETSLYLLGAGQTAGGGRYYDAAAGRFTSEDPIRHQAGDLKNKTIENLSNGQSLGDALRAYPHRPHC